MSKRRAESAHINYREVVVAIRGLVKSFGDNHVLREVDLDLHRGENLAVLGRSGSGKSVLIKCIVGLLRPSAGHISVFGREVGRLNPRELDHLRLKIGFNFQSSALYDSMTVRGNLEFPLVRNQKGIGRAEINRRVEEALENVGLLPAIDLMPSELSGGMRKRIGIARTLILQPDIMLYDEPTSGLDPVTSTDINELIIDLQERFNTTSIIITHDITCAYMTGNRIMVLIDGQFAVQGSYEEVAASTVPLVRQFFNY